MTTLSDVQCYWNQGIANVPWMTGAATLMDCADIKEHSEKLGFTLPFDTLLDVGCGSGRLSTSTAFVYLGVDVSVDAVVFCQLKCIPSVLITGPHDLQHPSAPMDWVTCLSVFTHIDRAERQAYLRVFTGWSPNLLVDIIPGDGSGTIELWTADWDLFQQDLTDTGWQINAWYDRVGPSGPMHRYAWAIRDRTF